MRRLLAFLLVAAFATSANAEPNLAGQWKSDADLSMRFNTERVKLDGAATLLISQVMGHLTVTFTADALASDLPDFETRTPDGRKSRWPGFHEIHPYRVLGATADSVAVKSVAPITGRDTITVYNFVGPDTMWVYTAGEDNTQSLHLREYFVRVKGKNAPKPGAPKDARP